MSKPSRFPVLVGLCVLLGMSRPAVAAPAPEEPAVPLKLLENRRDAARGAYADFWDRCKQGKSALEPVFTWSRNWLEAERALCKDRADEIAALEAHVKRIKEVEELARAMHEAGRLPNADLAAAKYYLAEAEIWLAKVKPGK